MNSGHCSLFGQRVYAHLKWGQNYICTFYSFFYIVYLPSGRIILSDQNENWHIQGHDLYV
jgi:hypothetical protein